MLALAWMFTRAGGSLVCRADGVLQFDDCTQFGANYGCGVSATLGEPVCQVQ